MSQGRRTWGGPNNSVSPNPPGGGSTGSGNPNYPSSGGETGSTTTNSTGDTNTNNSYEPTTLPSTNLMAVPPGLQGKSIVSHHESKDCVIPATVGEGIRQAAIQATKVHCRLEQEGRSSHRRLTEAEERKHLRWEVVGFKLKANGHHLVHAGKHLSPKAPIYPEMLLKKA